MAVIRRSDGTWWEYEQGMDAPRQLSEAEVFAVQASSAGAAGYAAKHHVMGAAGLLPGIDPRSGEDRAKYQAIRERHPVASFAGSAAPFALGPTKVTWPARVAYDAILGAVDVESGGEWWERAAISGAASELWNMGARITGRIANVFEGINVNRIPTDSIAQRAADQGYELTPGMRTGDKRIIDYEHSVSQVGVGPHIKHGVLQRNQRKLNEQAARSMGVQATPDGKVIDETYMAAEQRINDIYGHVFDEVTAKGGITLKSDTLTHAIRNLKHNVDMQDRLMAKATGKKRADGTWRWTLKQGEKLDGTEALAARQSLSPLISEGQDSNIRQAAFEAVENIDKEIGFKVGGDTKRTFDQARAQWRNYLAVKGARTPAGDITPGNLNRRLESIWGVGKIPDTWGSSEIGGMGREVNPAAVETQALKESAGALAAVMPRAGSMTPQGSTDIQESLWKSVTEGVPYYKYGKAPNYQGLFDPAPLGFQRGAAVSGRAGAAPAARQRLLDTPPYDEDILQGF